MKIQWFFSVILFGLITIPTILYGQIPVSISGPQIVLDKETHDFGEVFLNADGNCVFRLSDIANELLIITDIGSGCGSTVTEWPREPLPPGDTATIRVKYPTLNRANQINRSGAVTLNAKNKPAKLLSLVGRVIAPPEEITPGTNIDKDGTY